MMPSPTAQSRSQPRPRVLLMYVQRMVRNRNFEHLGNLGLLGLAAFLRTNGYDAKVFVGIGTDAAMIVEEESAGAGVGVVGFYCDYDNQSTVQALASRIVKRFGVTVIVGGPQAVNLGGEFLRASSCRALVRGDGEYTLLELLESLYGGDGNLSAIKGIVFLGEDGREVVTPERELIADLDSLPLPSIADLVRPAPQYNLPVIAARGCPYRCTFCYEGGNSKTLRMRGVKRVMEEIRARLAEVPGARYLWFADDTFTLDFERTAEFCSELAALRKEHDVVWFCEAHPKVLTRHPELVPIMLQAGMVRMQIGMETGWQPAMQKYAKQATVEEVAEVIRLSWEAGVPQLAGNFIIGGADETPETLEITRSHVERLIEATPGMLDIYTSFIIPLPSTAISNCPSQFGISLLDPGSTTSFEDFPVTETAKVGREDACVGRHRFVKMVSDTLGRLFAQGRIPEERILRHFELALRYGIASSWYSHFYSKEDITRRYFNALVMTSASRYSAVPRTEALAWYPCRIDGGVSCTSQAIAPPVGAPSGAISLSPLESAFLAACTGKAPLQAVLDGLGSLSPFETEDLLKGLEQKRLFVLHPP